MKTTTCTTTQHARSTDDDWLSLGFAIGSHKGTTRAKLPTSKYKPTVANNCHHKFNGVINSLLQPNLPQITFQETTDGVAHSTVPHSQCAINYQPSGPQIHPENRFDLHKLLPPLSAVVSRSHKFRNLPPSSASSTSLSTFSPLLGSFKTGTETLN